MPVGASPCSAHGYEIHVIGFPVGCSPTLIHRPESTSSLNKEKWNSILPVLKCALGAKLRKIHEGEEMSASILNVLEEGASWCPAHPRLICSRFPCV